MPIVAQQSTQFRLRLACRCEQSYRRIFALHIRRLKNGTGRLEKPPAQLCRQGFRSKPSRTVGMHGRAIDALEQTRSVSRPVIFAAALAKDAVHASSSVSRDKTKWMQRSDHTKTEQNSLSRKKAVRVYLVACSPAAVPATLLCVSSMLPISDPKKPPITADGGSFVLPPSPLPPAPFLSPPWRPS